MKYKLQIWCAGYGWADYNHPPESLNKAINLKRELINDDTKWMSGSKKRDVRIIEVLKTIYVIVVNRKITARAFQKEKNAQYHCRDKNARGSDKYTYKAISTND